MFLKKIFFSFMLVASVELVSSEQRCRELFKNLILTCLADYQNISRYPGVSELEKLLLLHPQAVRQPSVDLSLPLCIAAGQNIVWFAKILLKAGADAQADSKPYNSPLWESVAGACYYESTVDLRDYRPMIKLLIEHGANPDLEEVSRHFNPHYFLTPRHMMPELIKEIEKELKVKKAAEAVEAAEAAEAIALAALSMECASAQEPSRRPCVDFADDVARMLQLSTLRRIKE